MIASQTSLALEYLHTNEVTHRDLKSMNIFVTALASEHGTLIIKVTDFSLTSCDISLKTMCETREYVTSEVYNTYAACEYEADLKITYINVIDIWLFEIVLQQLLMSLQTHLFKTQRSHSFVPSQAHLKPQNLVHQMLLNDLKLRPSAIECLQHH